MAFQQLASSVLADNGSVSAPGMAFYNWQGTGWYIEGNGGVSLAVNGSKAIGWSASTGGFSIGQPSSTADNFVYGFLNVENAASNCHIRINNVGSGTAYIRYSQNSSNFFAVGIAADTNYYVSGAAIPNTSAATNYLTVTNGGLLTLGGSGGTQRHRINAAAATNAAQALTISNGPTGTSGNPTYWIQLNFNGTNIVVPAWTGA